MRTYRLPPKTHVHHPNADLASIMQSIDTRVSPCVPEQWDASQVTTELVSCTKAHSHHLGHCVEPGRRVNSNARGEVPKRTGYVRGGEFWGPDTKKQNLCPMERGFRSCPLLGVTFVHHAAPQAAHDEGGLYRLLFRRSWGYVACSIAGCGE